MKPADNLLIRALKGKKLERPPIWLMRQAGRYHRHYQDLRRQFSFMDLCKRPELAAHVALGPVLDFDFDAAILFSDLLFPLEALGMGLQYTDAGPQLGWKLTPQTRAKLRSVDEAWPHLLVQGDALRATRQLLPANKSLIGFVGGPWTLFVYAVEGTHKHVDRATKELQLFEKFCETLVPLLTKNIELQLANEAEVVMIFDTAAGELAPEVFHSAVVPQLERLPAPGRRLCAFAQGSARQIQRAGIVEQVVVHAQAVFDVERHLICRGPELALEGQHQRLQRAKPGHRDPMQCFDKRRAALGRPVEVRAFPEIKSTTGSYGDRTIEQEFYSSEGTRVRTQVTRSVAQLHFVAKARGRITSRRIRGGATKGFELFREEDVAAKAREGARATVPLQAKKGRASYLGERSIEIVSTLVEAQGQPPVDLIRFVIKAEFQIPAPATPADAFHALAEVSTGPLHAWYRASPV